MCKPFSFISMIFFLIPFWWDYWGSVARLAGITGLLWMVMLTDTLWSSASLGFWFGKLESELYSMETGISAQYADHVACMSWSHLPTLCLCHSKRFLLHVFWTLIVPSTISSGSPYRDSFPSYLKPAPSSFSHHYPGGKKRLWPITSSIPKRWYALVYVRFFLCREGRIN